MSLREIWQPLLGGSAGPGRQVRVWWLVGLAAVGAMLMILSGTGGRNHQQNQQAAPVSGGVRPGTVSPGDTAGEMEDHLQSILSQVTGAGKVEVEIHLADAGRTDYANNVNTDKKTSTQKDSGGTTNVTSDVSENDQVVMNQSPASDNGTPVISRKLAPRVDGVLIIAGGATNASVRAALTEAAAVALHVPPYEVLVLPGGGE